MKTRTIITSALLGLTLTLGAAGAGLADTPTNAATVAASPVAAPASVKAAGHNAMVAKGRHGERRSGAKHARHGGKFARAKASGGPAKSESKAG